jgi:hypothetical protein
MSGLSVSRTVTITRTGSSRSGSRHRRPAALRLEPRWRLPILVVLLAGLVALVETLAPGRAQAQDQGDRPVVGAWDAGATTVGVVRDDQWLLRFEHAGGPADTGFRYGRPGDEPMTGDWNGDGRTTVGIRRGSRFYLRDSITAGPADRVFHYGREGDAVLVGDWNGDGVQTVGVRRGSTFYLRNAHAGGAADVAFVYGRADDLPLAGDWNGSGTTTVGVRRETRFLLRNLNSGGPADLAYHFGRPHDPEPEPEPEPEPVEQVVASFTTPLVPGEDRNVNIRLAADLIDGDVIQPGASYSLNQGIGPRTRARGFVENGYIDSDGELISVVGGGVSQMGTTFLNAAWFAGLQLDEFRQHTIYFERYPMCREATLAWDLLDVVFTNDSPHPITVRTAHGAQSVTVSLVSIPWAEVDSWVGSPYSWIGESFRVDCGRTITYPDGTTTSERYSWRYDQTG